MPSLSAHAVLHTPDSCHLPLDSICGQTQHHQQNQSFVGSPCTTSLKQRRSAGSSGLVDSPRPTTTTAHTGPKPAPALALAPRRLTGQAQPEPHDNKGHQKEKKRSHTPVAVCREGTRPCRMPGQPSTHGHREVTGKRGREDTWPPSTAAPYSSGASRPGASEGGQRAGKGRQDSIYPPRHTTGLPSQKAERRAGSRSEQRSVQHSTIRMLPRPCSGHVTCNWTRPGAGGLSAISSQAPPHRQLIPLA